MSQQIDENTNILSLNEGTYILEGENKIKSQNGFPFDLSQYSSATIIVKGRTSNSDGYRVIELSVVNTSLTYHGYRIQRWDQWYDWNEYISNADLPNVFTGTNLATLNSPSQLTAPGFYYAEFMSNDVNANSGSNPMSDYSTGDFHMLLLAVNANSTSGCRYGTLLVTSPRLTSSLWIGRIWDYQFTYWAKK